MNALSINRCVPLGGSCNLPPLDGGRILISTVEFPQQQQQQKTVGKEVYREHNTTTGSSVSTTRSDKMKITTE